MGGRNRYSKNQPLDLCVCVHIGIYAHTNIYQILIYFMILGNLLSNISISFHLCIPLNRQYQSYIFNNLHLC